MKKKKSKKRWRGDQCKEDEVPKRIHEDASEEKWRKKKKKRLHPEKPIGDKPSTMVEDNHGVCLETKETSGEVH